MVNKKRVQVIRNIIYTLIFLIVVVPIVLVIILSAKLLFVLEDITPLLKQASVETTVQLQDPSVPESGSAADAEQSPQQPQGDESQSQPSGEDQLIPEPQTQSSVDNEPGGVPPQDSAVHPSQGDLPASVGESVKNTYSPASYPNLYFDTLPVSRAAEPKTLYLTFDNTPSSQAGRILDVLDKHGVKATFFVWWNESLTAGNLEFYKELVQKGHSIGIQSLSNSDILDDLYADQDLFMQGFSEIFTRIDAGTGVKTRLYRLPGGSVTPGNPQRQEALLAIKQELDARGFLQFDWTASGEDAVIPPLSKDQILANVKSSISSDGHVVVLLHDGTGSPSTADALDQFITDYTAAGYQFKAIEHDTATVSFLDN